MKFEVNALYMNAQNINFVMHFILKQYDENFKYSYVIPQTRDKE